MLKQMKLEKANCITSGEEMKKKEILERLKECIVNSDIEGIKPACRSVLDAGISPLKAITEGMAKGMNVVGKKYETGEYFLADLIIAGEVMKEGMKILEPHLNKAKIKRQGKAILGTTKGDLHDIGKNIFATLLMTAGFEIVDLGVDVPAEKFLDAIRTQNADILGVSALLTTTMPEIENMIKGVKGAGLRGKVKIIVGGAPLTEEYAKKVGADAYAPNAVAGVNICKKWMKQKS